MAIVPKYMPSDIRGLPEIRVSCAFHAIRRSIDAYIALLAAIIALLCRTRVTVVYGKWRGCSSFMSAILAIIVTTLATNNVTMLPFTFVVALFNAIGGRDLRSVIIILE